MAMATDTTSRLGISAADIFFSSNDWLFREQPIHDWGIDAHVEPKHEGKPTGQLIALQIKSGPSWFKSENADGVRHAISDWHMDYWLRHQLPVFIILHDPGTQSTIWQKVDRHLLKRTKDGNWYIRIPRSNVLNASSLAAFRDGLAGDVTAFRRSHLALDYPLMLKIATAGKPFLRVAEYNHKGLAMRGAWFRFDDEDKSEVDLVVERWSARRGIHAYMAYAFPWLDYKHTKPLEDRLGAIEAETHHLQVTLNEIGLSFVALEKYYTEGRSPLDYELPFADEDDEDEDDYTENAFRRHMDED